MKSKLIKIVQRKAVAVPIVDSINWDTLEHRNVYSGSYRGIFEWGFLYKETPVPDKEFQRHSRPTEPYW